MIQKYLNTYYNPGYVYREIKNYFHISELVHPRVLKKYGEEQCWSFLSFRLLSNLLFIRNNINRKIYSNRGNLKQRGIRSILSSIVLKYVRKGVLYLSPHTRGAGIDFDVDNMSATKVRQWIEANSTDLPYKCRLESLKNGKPISWVHMDVDFFLRHKKVYKFNV